MEGWPFRRPMLPIVYSGEAAECGLACLTMVAGYHGCFISLRGMRERFGTSIRGMSLRDVMRVAAELGLGTRPIKIDITELRLVRTPAILHWEGEHFVVLKRASVRSVTIHDPSKGELVLTWMEISRSFTGIALELEPNSAFVRSGRLKPVTLRRVVQATQGLWQAVWQVCLLSVLAQAIALATPLFAQLAIDQAVEHYDLNLLAKVSLVFALLTAIGPFFSWVRNWTIQYVGTAVAYQITGSTLSHLVSLPIGFFEKRQIGDLLSRLQSIQPVQQFLTEGLFASSIDAAIAVLAAFMIFRYDFALGAIVLLGIGAAAGFAAFLQPRLRSLTYKEANARAVEQAYIYQTLRGIQTVKIFGGEVERVSIWSNLYVEAMNAILMTSRIRITTDEFRTLALQLQTVAMIYVAGAGVISGRLSIGTMFAILAFRQILAERVQLLLLNWQKYGVLSVHLDRLGDILDAPSERVGPERRTRPTSASVEFSSVSFRYSYNEQFVLKHASICVRDGEFVAISGKSGAGKSTALKMILGLYTPQEGEVLLGGVSLEKLDIQAWRETLGVVSQDDQLFSGSVAENITFFAAETDRATLRQATTQACILEEIEAMPMGFESLIGDMGSTLSGGQRQRILLARALYRKPSLLVLDEGTANLDLETEQQISDIIAGLKISRIVIAHRPALIARADRCFVMVDGKFKEAPSKAVASAIFR